MGRFYSTIRAKSKNKKLSEWDLSGIRFVPARWLYFKSCPCTFGNLRYSFKTTSNIFSWNQWFVQGRRRKRRRKRRHPYIVVRKGFCGAESDSVVRGVTVVVELLFNLVLFLKTKPLLKKKEKTNWQLIINDSRSMAVAAQWHWYTELKPENKVKFVTGC